MQKHRHLWKQLFAFLGLSGLFITGNSAWAQQTTPSSSITVEQWLPITTGITNGISGMALVEQKESTTDSPARRVFLVVHDNKKLQEGRLSLLTVQAGAIPTYTSIAWPKEARLPIDLEALSAIPGQPGAFFAVESDGILSRLQLNATHTAVQVTTTIKLPSYKEGVKANIEGFSLAQIGSTPVAVWATRGSNAQPATLYYATLDLQTNTFGTVSTAPLIAPWPLAPNAAELAANPNLDVRAVSDLKIDPTGTLFVSSASDAGDDGPFNSAFYLAGNIVLVSGTPLFVANSSPWLLGRWPGHKIEAFDFVPGPYGGPVFGTDDENAGGAVWMR